MLRLLVVVATEEEVGVEVQVVDFPRLLPEDLAFALLLLFAGTEERERGS